MIECTPSAFLEARKPLLKAITAILATEFDYASILGTDDAGISFHASRGETGTGEPMWGQRGFVVRAQREGRVGEFAFNELDDDNPRRAAERIAIRLRSILDTRGGARTYPLIPDEPVSASKTGSFVEDPFVADPEAILARLAKVRDALLTAPNMAAGQSRADFVRVSRVFVSPRRDLFQTFLWTQAYAFGVIRRGDQAKNSYRALSGLQGVEVIDRLEAQTASLVEELGELLDAGRVEPGEYEVIMTPEVAGTLAHEAFGHGVETDMFVKGRAKALEYIGKAVASPIVTMYDGATGVEHSGSFLFDDEGSLGTRTLVIDKGILVGGFSDILSALALGTAATGNGRRQAYDHKAYARMTNTYFAPGSSSLNEMIASVRQGWLLDRLNSGMEDPKNWGIQLIALVGREIRDGKLSGRIASPVYCSGYVPDVLTAIDMVSRDFALAGSGACGKGHKEYVKVSSGGPYVKTRMRLG
jgi:TldD protein